MFATDGRIEYHRGGAPRSVPVGGANGACEYGKYSGYCHDGGGDGGSVYFDGRWGCASGGSGSDCIRDGDDLDVDTGGVGGNCGSGDGATDYCASAGGGDTPSDDSATSVCGESFAKYGAVFPEMEEAIGADVGVLPDVLAAIRGVATSGVCNYHECEGRVYVATWTGGADFPAVFLVEIDADERDVPR